LRVYGTNNLLGIKRTLKKLDAWTAPGAVPKGLRTHRSPYCVDT